jgi:hypothetical protein
MISKVALRRVRILLETRGPHIKVKKVKLRQLRALGMNDLLHRFAPCRL